LFVFVVLGLVSSVLRQEVSWEERLRNYLFCVEWDIKPELSQLTLQCRPANFVDTLMENS